MFQNQKMGHWPIPILCGTTAGQVRQATKNPMAGLLIYQELGDEGPNNRFAVFAKSPPEVSIPRIRRARIIGA
jgi:hypothetical protein